MFRCVAPRVSFEYKKALEKKRNVPRRCSVPMCPTSPLTLNIKCHLWLVHPGLDPGLEPLK